MSLCFECWAKFQHGDNLVSRNKVRKNTMAFLYIVGNIRPKSSLSKAVVLRSNRHLSSMTSVPRRAVPVVLSEPDEPDDERASATSHLLPCSSTITRLWLEARPEVSRYTSIISGGGLLSKLPHTFQVRSSSRKSSKSCVCIWNFKGSG